MNIDRLKFVIRKEMRQMRRDPRVVRMSLIAPVIQLVLFGYAATTDLKDARVAICDRDHGVAARQFITSLSHQRYFRVRLTGDDPHQLPRELDSGRAQIALDIPPDFSRDLARGGTATVQMLIDGSDSNTAQTAAAYLTASLRHFGREVAVAFAQRHGSPIPTQVVSKPRLWYNPDLRSANYMLPAIVGLILLVLTTNFTALSVVRERENGTLEQLIVTPLRPLELLLGKMIPVALLGLVDALLIVTVSVLWFHVPLRGSVILLFALSGGFLLCTLGTGLLISTVSRTQQQAQMTNFFLTMPSILLSGLMFPTANMPAWAQAISYLIPMRYFIVVVRGIYLKGNDLSLLWPEAAALFALGLVTLTGGVLAFRKRIE